ncbi:MAG TPA: hypothetical protein VFA17_04630 [Thermoplasmata archaeon]|jgi:hypothetical protein|nr:hypothetical protein [Thermoplasmata archaeon]
MDPPNAAPHKGRLNVLFAILAIALLLAGIAAGYILGRPAASTPPGPVNHLARTSTIPRVDGWFRNASVTYLDFGPQPNVAVPILAFFQASSPTASVASQRNIIDTIPGQPGYSDFWRVHKVLVPSGYVPNTIRSFADAVASGYTIEATDIIVNCPVVNPNATLGGGGGSLTLGWYRDREVSYFDEGTRSPAAGWIIQDAPIYAFFHADGTPVAGQRNVIDVLPGSPGYSDLWNVMKVIVGPSYMANTLQDARSILAARDAGQLTIETTTIHVNCPVVS